MAGKLAVVLTVKTPRQPGGMKMAACLAEK